MIQNVLNYPNFLRTNRSSHRGCSVKKGFLRNFAKFTGKHLFQRLFLNKVAGLRPQDVKIMLHDKRKQYENKITIKGKISPR